MDTFKLDTSGEVQNVPTGIAGICGDYRWSDLTPFQQGYVEVLFANQDTEWANRPWLWGGMDRPGFSDLSPEALARIIADCEVAASILGRDNRSEDGAWFWNGGKRQPGFPPLTPYLSEDGKIHLKEGAA